MGRTTPRFAAASLSPVAAALSHLVFLADSEWSCVIVSPTIYFSLSLSLCRIARPLPLLANTKKPHRPTSASPCSLLPWRISRSSPPLKSTRGGDFSQKMTERSYCNLKLEWGGKKKKNKRKNIRGGNRIAKARGAHSDEIC